MIIQKHYYDTIELHSIVIEVQEIILTLLKLPPKTCLFSDEQEKYIYGNIKEDKVENIWKGKKANDFRNTLLNSRESFDICRNCNE